MNFSKQQIQAINNVATWATNPDSKQVFRLSGYAGTGKTTIAKEIAETVGGKTLFVAYTGKAAYVLNQKGCEATTIHKLIYLPKNKAEANLKKLESDLVELKELLINQGIDSSKVKDHRRVLDLKRLIAKEEDNLKRPSFTLNLDSEIRNAKLVIADEASMIGTDLAEDLLSFGVKVLVLYDEGQLPPVKSKGYFINKDPDFRLTEIHRQAADNPIIQLATKIRKGESIPCGEYGESLVLRGKVDPKIITDADQLIVGKNDTRTKYNKRLKELLGIPSVLPLVGDRLVCLKNNHELGLLNGAIYNVLEISEEVEDQVQMSLEGEDGSNILVNSFTHVFKGEEVPYWLRQDAEEFDYGYALTCHKSQGSQWNTVVVKDESYVFKHNSAKWLYTAVTRAAEKVIILK